MHLNLETERSPLARSLPEADTAHAYAWAYEHLFFPAWQRVVRGRGIASYLEELERTQWLPQAAIEALQLERTRALLRHAKECIPYYRELFTRLGFDPGDVTERAHLAQLPLLTRDIVRERYSDLIDPTRRETNIKKGTSGTTGRPLTFQYCNDSEAWRQAVRLRGYGWAGYHQGLPTLHYWAQGAVVPRGIRSAKVRLDRALRREIYVDAIRHDEASLEDAVSAIRSFRPHVIIGYTQATALLARYVIERGVRDWDDIPVICGAEAVLPGDRDALSRAFGPGIFETYGSRETMLIAAECSAHDGMHLSEENLLVEVTSEGTPVADGELGDIVITDLHNYGMPFIRYLNGDVGVMAKGGDRCVCGRGLRKLERVDGRRTDTLVDSDGRPIPGMLFIALFATHRALVRQFQVEQRGSGGVKLRVVPGREFSDQELDKVVARFRGYLKKQPIDVEIVEAIEPGPNGKRRPIVRLA